MKPNGTIEKISLKTEKRLDIDWVSDLAAMMQA